MFRGRLYSPSARQAGAKRPPPWKYLPLFAQERSRFRAGDDRVLLRYDSRPQPLSGDDCMLIGWKTTALTITLTIIVAGSLTERAVNAAPQTATASKALSAAAPSAGDSVAIPETTLAINSPTPMSERVVHYEIDAKYDANTHTVNATQVLTYHNLTGQALDHFPFHLYQNAF